MVHNVNKKYMWSFRLPINCPGKYLCYSFNFDIKHVKSWMSFCLDMKETLEEGDNRLWMFDNDPSSI